jgi:hypothetical protein
MQTKIKAALAVTIMVAAAFAALIPAVIADEQNSDAAKWTDDVTYTVTKDYAFSYKVILPMSSSVFTVTSNTVVDPVVADHVYNGTFTVTGVTNLYTTGATVTATISKTTTLTFTAYSTLTGESVVKKIIFTVDNATDSAINNAALTGAVDSEFSHSVAVAVTGYTAVYSALNMPAGLTMENDGTIYGAPAVAGTYTVTVYALLTNTAKTATTYQSKEVVITVAEKVTAATYKDIVTAVNVSIANDTNSNVNIYGSGTAFNGVYPYYYVHSGAGTLTYTLSDATQYTYGAVKAPAGVEATVSGNQLVISNLSALSGEFTLEIKVTNTLADGNVIDSYVDFTFYVIPSESFLTTPVAGMQIVYA